MPASAREVLGRVGELLARPSTAIQQELDRLEKETSAVPFRGAAGAAAALACSWLRSILGSEYAPPETVACLATPLEGGLCDTVRARFGAGGLRFETGQACYVLSLRILDLPDSREEPWRQAEILARRIFRPDAKENLVFRDLGGDEHGRYGDRDFSRVPALDEEWPHWLDLLRWFHHGSSLGFITLRASGGPTREHITEDAGANRHWFRVVE